MPQRESTASPELDAHCRAEQRSRRREIPAAVALMGFGATGVLFGRGSALAVFVGLWIIGLGVFFLAGRVLRDRQEHGAGPRGRLATRDFGGVPATVLHQHPAREATAAVFLAYVGAFFVGAGWFAQGDGASPGSLVPLLVVALPFVLVGVRRFVRARRSGVWLTPDALTVREGGTTYRTAWEDVAAVSEVDSPTALVVVLPRSTAALTVTGRDRGSRKGTVLGDIPLRSGATPVDAYALVDVIWHYQAAENRSELGTPAALARVRRFEGAHR